MSDNLRPGRVAEIVKLCPDMPYVFGFGSVYMFEHKSHLLCQLVEPEHGFQGKPPGESLV